MFNKNNQGTSKKDVTENARDRLHNNKQDLSVTDHDAPSMRKSDASAPDSLHLSRAENPTSYRQPVDKNASKNRGDVAQIQHAAQNNTISYSTGDAGGDEIGGATRLNKQGDFERVSTDLDLKNARLKNHIH